MATLYGPRYLPVTLVKLKFYTFHYHICDAKRLTTTTNFACVVTLVVDVVVEVESTSKHFDVCLGGHVPLSQQLHVETSKADHSAVQTRQDNSSFVIVVMICG